MSAKSASKTAAATDRPRAGRANKGVRGVPTSVPHLERDSDDAKFGRLVYERVRLGIMSALAVNDELSFSDLKSLFDVSDGNLSAHARKLEEAGYLSCTKTFAERRPKSSYKLTVAGRKALHRYLEHMEAVIKATRRG
jgi:DNA-binding MarR family transcriptional regulator